VGANGNECENRGIELIKTGRECDGDWIAGGLPALIVHDRECLSSAGWLNLGSRSTKTCVAACSGYEAFQIMDGGSDGNGVRFTSPITGPHRPSTNSRSLHSSRCRAT
jgi:hypothetical protein